jgi:F0F1-type ATP synthase assembly protein I
MANSPNPKSEDLNIGTFAGAGLQFAIGIVLFLFLGRWADRHFGTGSLFLILAVFIGGAGGFYSMYRRISQAQKADDERRARQKAQENQR